VGEQLRAAQESAEALEGELKGLRDLSARSKQRETELESQLADKDRRLELLQRRLNAQDTELAALRRATGRAPSSSITSTDKAELLQRSAGGAVLGAVARSTVSNAVTSIKAATPEPLAERGDRRAAVALPLDDEPILVAEEADVVDDLPEIPLSDAEIEEIDVEWPGDATPRKER